jgi:hypothetical protein
MEFDHSVSISVTPVGYGAISVGMGCLEQMDMAGRQQRCGSEKEDREA